MAIKSWKSFAYSVCLNPIQTFLVLFVSFSISFPFFRSATKQIFTVVYRAGSSCLYDGLLSVAQSQTVYAQTE